MVLANQWPGDIPDGTIVRSVPHIFLDFISFVAHHNHRYPIVNPINDSQPIASQPVHRLRFRNVVHQQNNIAFVDGLAQIGSARLRIDKFSVDVGGCDKTHVWWQQDRLQHFLTRIVHFAK